MFNITDDMVIIISFTFSQKFVKTITSIMKQIMQVVFDISMIFKISGIFFTLYPQYVTTTINVCSEGLFILNVLRPLSKFVGPTLDR